MSKNFAIIENAITSGIERLLQEDKQRLEALEEALGVRSRDFPVNNTGLIFN